MSALSPWVRSGWMAGRTSRLALAVLIGFVGMMSSTAGRVAIGIPVVLGSVAITLLEIFVAFLQAFIFTFLTSLFIGQAVVLHHGEEHGVGEHGH